MTTQQELTPELIRAALTTVKFPGFSRDIVSFGLVKKIDIDAENNVTIDLVIESKNADIPRYIFEGVHGVMKHLPGVKHCDVNIEHKAPEARKGINDDPSTWKSSLGHFIIAIFCVFVAAGCSRRFFHIAAIVRMRGVVFAQDISLSRMFHTADGLGRYAACTHDDRNGQKHWKRPFRYPFFHSLLLLIYGGGSCSSPFILLYCTSYKKLDLDNKGAFLLCNFFTYFAVFDS